MTILFDVDGVLANLHVAWLKRYNLEYHDRLAVKDIIKWDIHELVKPECGTKVYDYLDYTIYDEVSPIRGAREAVQYARQWSRVIFVTTPCNNHGGAKLVWLNKHGFEVDKKDYIECHDKSLIRGDVLIDDYPNNLLGFVGLPILFDRPWNQESWLRRIVGFGEEYQTLLAELYR